MIEELLDKMLYNMKDYLDKMYKSKNNDLETLKQGIIQEWDCFIPYGGVHDMGLSIINSVTSVAELEYEIFYRKEIRRNYKLLLLELENFDYCPNMELITKLANAKFIFDENERLIKEK